MRYFRYQLADQESDPVLSRGKDAKPEDEGLAWFDAEEINHLLIRPEDRSAIAKFFQDRGV